MTGKKQSWISKVEHKFLYTSSTQPWNRLFQPWVTAVQGGLGDDIEVRWGWGHWAPQQSRPVVGCHPQAEQLRPGFCHCHWLVWTARWGGVSAQRVTGNQRGEGVWGSWLDRAGRTPRPLGKESGTGWGLWGKTLFHDRGWGPGWCVACVSGARGGQEALSRLRQSGGQEAWWDGVRGQLPLAERSQAGPCAWPGDLAELCLGPLATGNFTLTPTHIYSHLHAPPHSATLTCIYHTAAIYVCSSTHICAPSYACLYTSVHTHAQPHTSVHTHSPAHNYAHSYAHSHAYPHTCSHTHTCTHIHVHQFALVLTHTLIHTHTHLTLIHSRISTQHSCAYTPRHSHIHSFTGTHLCACTHTHPHTPTHTHIHSRAHTHTRVHTLTVTRRLRRTHLLTHMLTHVPAHSLLHSHTHSLAFAPSHTPPHTHTPTHTHSLIHSNSHTWV